MRRVFARGAGLMAGAEVCGDPVRVLPVLYHLLWRHELAVDLHSSLLSGAAWVTPGRMRRDGGGHGDASASVVGG